MRRLQLYNLHLKDLFRDRFFFVFITVNIVISLIGIIGVENFKSAFRQSIEKRAKEITGADLVISSRLPIDENKILEIKKIITPEMMINSVSFFSMAIYQNLSKLVRVEEFHSEFPFYGQRQFSNVLEESLKEDEVIIYPSIKNIFNVVVGDRLKIGSQYFKIISEITSDNSETFNMGQIAPKVLLSKSGIQRGEFLQVGSTSFNEIFFKLKIPPNDELKNKIIDLFDDPSIRVQTFEDSSGQVGRVLEYLGDFLGLVSIMAILLVFFGLFYLFNSFFIKRMKNISIYKAIGIRDAQIIEGFLFEIILLSTFGLFISVISSQGLNLIGQYLLGPYLAQKISIGISFEGVFVSSIILFCLIFILLRPILRRIVSLEANQLFQEYGMFNDDLSKSILKSVITLFPFLYLLSFYLSKSFILSSALVVGLILGLVIVFVLLQLIFKILPKNLGFEFKLAIRYLTKNKLSTLSIFISLFFGSALINFLPVVEKSINNEIMGPQMEFSPEYFMFDIQEDQLHKILNDSSDNFNFLKISPMIRSRLLKINGKNIKVEKNKALTREQQRANRFQNRGVNLSYADNLSAEDQLIDGKFIPNFSGTEDIPITLETRYMDRINVQLGDQLTFDIMGLEFSTRVVGRRQIKWSSFLPNFFILFPKGVLEDVPKSFLASVSLKNTNSFSLANFNQSFPNISMVDIRDISKKVLKVMSEMSVALMFLSFLSIFVGLLIMISLINHQLLERKPDLILFHRIGLTKTSLEKIISYEIILISLISILFGAIFGQLVGLFTSYKMFYSMGSFSLKVLALTLILVAFISLITTKFSMRNFFRKIKTEI